MIDDHRSLFRRDALQAACEAMQDLDLIGSTGPVHNESQQYISGLSQAIFAAADANLTHYLRLIFALAKSPEWHQRLVTDRHFEKCVTLSEGHIDDGDHLYLVGFFLRFALRRQEASRITNKQWWTMIKKTWYSTGAYFLTSTGDTINDFLNLVQATETYIPRALPQNDLESFSKRLDGILDYLGREGLTNVVPAVARLKGVVDGELDAT